MYIYIYIYIYTRFQKGFHIDIYFCFLTRAPVCIYTCYCPTCEKTRFNNNFCFRQVPCSNLSIKKIMHVYCLQFSWFAFSWDEIKKMCFRNRWEGRCDGGCPYWICGKEQQYYSSWLKRTKTLTRFIEADFIITMMSWSCILMSHLFSCKITACKATSHWRQNKLSATNAFKLVYSFS